MAAGAGSSRFSETPSAEDPRPVVHVEPVMGTVASFHIWPEPGCGWGEALREACELLHRADRVFSTWDPASPVSRLRLGAIGLDETPDEVEEVIRLCRVANELSGGWFDPWAMPGGFDPTGLVKGWAVERAARVLRGGPVDGALVNAGGDIAVFGSPGSGGAWTVGVRHPERSDALACVLRVDAAVATSGTYERGAHLFDPWTGSETCRAASATVTGPSLAIADALATALAVAGEDGLRFVAAAAGYEGLVIRADGTASATTGLVTESA